MSDILQAVYRGDRDEAERLAAQQDLDVFEASALGDTERVRELVSSDPELANAWAEDGFQPLGLASFFGHEDTARALVERGAEVNSPSRNPMKGMPLHSAAAAQDPDVPYSTANPPPQPRAHPH